MPPFFISARQFGKRRALDLVRQQLDELEKRSENLSADDPLIADLYQQLQAAMASADPGETPALVPIMVKSYDEIKLESRWM